MEGGRAKDLNSGVFKSPSIEDVGSTSAQARQDLHESEPGDLWYDDDDSSRESSVEKLKIPSDMDREWQRRHDEFHTIGYRDGIIAGKEASAQEGFNIGFKDSVSIGYNWGLARGITRPGIIAGKEAGMKVVDVPSIPKQSQLFTSADEDFQPYKWGLPAFKDWVEGTLPIEPWYIGGPVIKGFGRGSKVLGIPTANLSTEGYSALLSDHPSGVYFGWARLATRGVYKMVMSIGWNPYFNNTEKTIEPWLLHDFNEDFYGEDLQLAIVGYIRPEANFPSLETLKAKIYEDREIAEKALDLPLYSKYKDTYLNTAAN